MNMSRTNFSATNIYVILIFGGEKMGINEYIQIGNKLRKARTEKGYTQKQFAELVGIPYSTYSNYENNNREPGRESLERIANALGLSVIELLEFWEVAADTPNDVSEDKPFSFPALEKKVEEIGYGIIYGTYENSDGIEISPSDILIKYPDGKEIYITPSDLENLNDDTDSYLKFKLEELRKKKQK